jgi:hypothetical protein
VLFEESDAVQLRGLQLFLETLPNPDSDVFGGRNLAGELSHFLVEMPVVERVHDLAVKYFLEFLEIDDKTLIGGDIALHRDFKGVIVPMTVGVIAFAEDTAVLLRREVGVVINV